jgi:hypothetical protein
MKTKFPITGLIKLESDEAQWLMFTKQLIRELSFTALIEKEPNCIVRVKINVISIYSPDMVQYNSTSTFRTNFENAVSNGMIRIVSFLDNHLSKNSWLFMGYIEGQDKKRILITFYQSINLAVYSLKLETDDNFSPVGLN